MNSTNLRQKFVEYAQNFLVISGEIKELNGVFQLASFFGVFGDGSENVLNVAVEFVDDAGTPNAVVGVDPTQKQVEFASVQNQLAQTRQEEIGAWRWCGKKNR